MKIEAKNMNCVGSASYPSSTHGTLVSTPRCPKTPPVHSWNLSTAGTTQAPSVEERVTGTSPRYPAQRANNQLSSTTVLEFLELPLLGPRETQSHSVTPGSLGEVVGIGS